MDARVIISPETIKKVEKPLSKGEKSKLRLQKLYEIAENGKLFMAKTKSDVGLMCGYTEKEKAKAYSFTSYLIKKGILNERLCGRNPYTGFPEYEYSLKERAETPNPLKEVVKEVEPAKTMPIAEYDDDSGITLQIKKDGITITFEKLDVAKATELTMKILGV